MTNGVAGAYEVACNRKGEFMRLRNLAVWIFGVPLLIFIYAISSNGASAEYVAEVNGAKIKDISLEAAVTNFVENQKMMGIPVKEEDMTELRKDILEELISAELLYQESQRARLGNLDKEINEQFDNIKKTFGSDDEFNKVLKDRGVTAKELKEDIKRGTYIKRFLEEKVYAGINITEEEKEAEYEKNKDRLNVPEHVRASHILVRVAPDANEEDKKAARDKIENLRKTILAGEDFAEIAKENSEDGAAPNGGDLGYFKKGDMVKPFEDAAFNLETGKVSDIVETQFGYHLMKVTDKKPAHKLTYAEVERDLETFLMNKHQREKVVEYIEELRKKANIKRYID